MFDHRRLPYPYSARRQPGDPGTVAGLDDVDLGALFATPPTEFVAARNDLVKQLRKNKEREVATAVAAIRRPAWTDFALNVTSREHDDAVEAFADAAGDVRDAQAAAIEGRDGPDVRDTLRTLRERTNLLLEHANAVLESHGRSGETPELMARLSDVAGNPQAVEHLRTGRLGMEGEQVADLFAGLQPARPTPRPKPPPRSPAATRPASLEPAPIASATARRQRQRDLDAAEGRLRRTRRAQREAESEVKAAADAVKAAARTLELAERRLDKARSTAEDADAAADRDQQAVDALADEAHGH